MIDCMHDVHAVDHIINNKINYDSMKDYADHARALHVHGLHNLSLNHN